MLIALQDFVNQEGWAMTVRSATEIVHDRLAADPPGGIRLGVPQAVGSLTVFPLFTNGEPAEYELFAAARAKTAEVTESGGHGSVPTLEAKNSGAIPVLMIEGEILIGLKQNRMLNTTILVPPKTNLTVPVSCVEAHRWNRMTAKAGVSRYAISPRIRGAKMETLKTYLRAEERYATDQGVIWEEVAQSLGTHNVRSRTAAYSDIEATRHDEIEHLLGQLKPDVGQTGVLAFVGDQPLSLDLFDQPSTLSSAWKELVGSYVSDSLVSKADPATIAAERAAEWVRGLTAGESSCHPAVGLGETVLITSDEHNMTALVVDGVPVHIAAWPKASTHR